MTFIIIAGICLVFIIGFIWKETWEVLKDIYAGDARTAADQIKMFATGFHSADMPGTPDFFKHFKTVLRYSRTHKVGLSGLGFSSLDELVDMTLEAGGRSFKDREDLKNKIALYCLKHVNYQPNALAV